MPTWRLYLPSQLRVPPLSALEIRLEAKIGTLADSAVSAAAQHESGRCAGVSRILDDDGAVDDDGCARAARIAMRVRVRRLVLKVIPIKDCNVGPVALPQQPAVAQFERLRRPAAHLVNRLLERDQPFIADVAPDNSRECAVETRMRHALADDP